MKSIRHWLGFVTRVFIPLLVNIPVFAVDLEGQWIVDVEANARFSESHPDLTESEEERLRTQERRSCFVSEMNVDDTVIVMYQPERKCVIDGKEFKIYSSESKHKYKSLSSTDSALVIQYLDEPYAIETLFFVNKDSYWVYYPGSPPDYGEHARIYYRRK